VVLAPGYVTHDPTIGDVTMVLHSSALHAAREIDAAFSLGNRPGSEFIGGTRDKPVVGGGEV
jgi:hypothetical protein